jgi:hypothetical protein
MLLVSRTHDRLATSASRLGRLVTAAALTFAVVGTTACGSDSKSPTGTGGGVTGTYNIASVSGPSGTDNSAPFVMLGGTVTDDQGGQHTFRIDITNGTLQLKSDKTYTAQFGSKLYVDEQEQTDNPFDFPPETGTYSVSGSTITFTDSDGEESTATVNGNQISRTEPIDLDGDGSTDANITIVMQK